MTSPRALPPFEPSLTRPKVGRYIALVKCCLHGWRPVEDMPADWDTVDEASIAAEDDACHHGDTCVIADLAERRVAYVAGPAYDPADTRRVLDLAREAVPA